MIVEVEGCCEGEEGESCPPVPGMCSQLASNDTPGASGRVWLWFPALRPPAFIRGLVFFPPPLLHKTYLKGLRI